jgi:hypothetical protein
VDDKGRPRHSLLFARGQLVTVYRAGATSLQPAVRLDPTDWLASLNGASANSAAVLRSLALTPQGVRIIKILIEQDESARSVSSNGLTLDKQFAVWRQHPAPALAHVRWPGADGLALLPGRGAAPYFSLFLSADKILHSAGSLEAMLAWPEAPLSIALYSSETPGLAWSEYLLHHAFSALLTGVLEKFEKLTSRMAFNQVIHDVNFTASAHNWEISLYAGGINDQNVFASPQAAALVYARLLVRDSLMGMPNPYRAVLNQYLFGSRPLA